MKNYLFNGNAYPMMPSHTNPGDVEERFTGMTKLELVSALAMQGILSSEAAYNYVYQGNAIGIAEQAVDFAKALLRRAEEVK